MANQRVRLGETFSFRVPTNASAQVVEYLDGYRQRYTKGFGEHLLYLVQKGMEAEGLSPSRNHARVHQSPSTRQSPHLTSSGRLLTAPISPVITTSPTVSTTPINQPVQPYINLSNFE